MSSSANIKSTAKPKINGAPLPTVQVQRRPPAIQGRDRPSGTVGAKGSDDVWGQQTSTTVRAQPSRHWAKLKPGLSEGGRSLLGRAGW